MTKKKKFKVDKTIIISALVVLLASVGFVGAQGLSFGDRIADKAGEILGNGLIGRFIGNFNIGNDEELGHAVSSTKWLNQNGLVTFIEGGDFIDASTTVVSFVNPFSNATNTAATAEPYNLASVYTATATVDLIMFHITTPATTTIDFTCGAAADENANPSYNLMTVHLPTSTPGIFQNNTATTTAGLGAIGGGTVAKILLTHDFPYFTCKATRIEGSEDLTNTQYFQSIASTTNDFDGTWRARIYKDMGY